MKLLGIQRALFGVLLFLSNGVFASDHIDGVPSLELHEQLDLTDLYVFPTANKPNHLSLIVNLYAGAADDAVFSEHVAYQVIIRKADIEGNSSTTQIVTSESEQAMIRCAVAAHTHHNDPQSLTCKMTRQQGQASQVVAQATTIVGQLPDKDQSPKPKPFKLFAGARSDPFFMSLDHFKQVAERQGFEPMPEGSGKNLLAHINVLTIALEFDMTLLFPNMPQGIYAVAAESLATTEDGTEKVFDRVGRPEITNLSLHRVNDEKAAIKEAYNQRHTFAAVPSKQAALFIERLRSNIAAYDQLDGVSNWSDSSLEQLTTLLMQDVQLIDLSKPCPILAKDTVVDYFAIEYALLQGKTHRTCGGRRLTDDVMRTIYALYIGGLAAKPTSFETGVSQPYQSSDNVLMAEFPYLAEPEPTAWLNINMKRFLINHIVKRRQD
ncbi:MAG: DUF4331 family protein [bacterium]